MSPLPSDTTDPFELAHFGADARAFSEEEFAARHGSAFLLHHGNLDPSRRPLSPQATMILGRVLPTEGTKPPPPNLPRKEHDAKGALRVYPVRHTGRSPYPRIVTVGRTKNNDIVLADISISKFHAFFKEENGQFFLADGESRNGTFVDNDRALPTKLGKPTPLRGGMRVKFGAVEFRFIEVKELLSLVRQFA